MHPCGCACACMSGEGPRERAREWGRSGEWGRESQAHPTLSVEPMWDSNSRMEP